MKTRSISNILFAREFDMGGLPIRQPFPSPEMRQADPFILLHHAQFIVPRGINLDEAGVGPHPHRGFSPVSFIFKGAVHHRDSRGNDSVISAGGTQWMNAGSGMLHSERPPKEIYDLGGMQELIQMWVNTPAAQKSAEPQYHPLRAEDTPKVSTEDGLGELFVQAGEVLGVKGVIPTPSPVNAATLYLKQGANVSIPIPEDHNTFLYLLEGEIRFGDGKTVNELHSVVFNTDGEGISFETVKPTRALFMSGLPLNEPVEMYGPFVMNSQAEVREAIVDYQLGKFGNLEV